jgi:hypothetical protein
MLILTVKEEVTENWRKFHSEELHDLLSSPYIIMAIKLKKSEKPSMWYIWKRGEMYTWFLQGMRVSNYLEDLEIDRRITLR